MAVKKDLSVEYLGVKCQNPFFLSSSPVGSNYEMVAIRPGTIISFRAALVEMSTQLA